MQQQQRQQKFTWWIWRHTWPARRAFVRWLDMRVFKTNLIQDSPDVMRYHAGRAMTFHLCGDTPPMRGMETIYLVNGDIFDISVHTRSPSGIEIREPETLAILIGAQARAYAEQQQRVREGAPPAARAVEHGL